MKNIEIERLDSDSKDSIMLEFGIQPIDMMIFENTILGNMIAPGDKNTPIYWSKVSFFDSDYEKDLKTLIPLNPDDEDVYTIHNPVGGNYIEKASAKVMALTSMFFFTTYLFETKQNKKLSELYDSLRALAYSSNFLNKKEQNHFFKLTD